MICIPISSEIMEVSWVIVMRNSTNLVLEVFSLRVGLKYNSEICHISMVFGGYCYRAGFGAASILIVHIACVIGLVPCTGCGLVRLVHFIVHIRDYFKRYPRLVYCCILFKLCSHPERIMSE